MKEQIIYFVDQYAVWGILIFTVMAVLLLWRLLRQQKRLNRSLGTITERIQAYFDVILTEEEPEEISEREIRQDHVSFARETRQGDVFPTAEARREERFLTREERELLEMRRKEQVPDEEVFNTVLQEFFS